MEEYIQVFTTTDKEEDARKIARILVEKKLAACVQIIGPIKSIYRWKGNVEESVEWLLIIKSRKVLYEELERVVKEIHPYETPEIVATPIVGGSKDYFEWFNQTLKKSKNVSKEQKE